MARVFSSWEPLAAPRPAAFVPRKGRKEKMLPHCLSNSKIKNTEFKYLHVYTAIVRGEDSRTTLGLKSSPRRRPGLSRR